MTETDPDALDVSPIAVEFDEDESRDRGRPVWRLVRPVRYQDGVGLVLDIPAGFETDLASVPRPLWAIFPPFGFHLRAAIVHDFLYAGKRVSRARADAIFLAVMRRYGVKRWRRIAMYMAVRLFGGRGWER